jgi:hypothetical protein
MRPADLAHIVIVVQFTTQESGETAAQRNQGSGAP